MPGTRAVAEALMKFLPAPMSALVLLMSALAGIPARGIGAEPAEYGSTYANLQGEIVLENR
jgi:hypothetical protein